MVLQQEKMQNALREGGYFESERGASFLFWKLFISGHQYLVYRIVCGNNLA